MASARYIRRSPEPSLYTINRNAEKDAEALVKAQEARDRETRIKAHEAATLKISQDNLELAQARRKDEQDRHDLDHAKIMTEMAAKELKTAMEKINADREALFLKELNTLDPEKFDSYKKRNALIERFHGLPKLSAFGDEALKEWDHVMNLTVADELVKRKAAADKLAAAEEKRRLALTDRHRKEFDSASSALEGHLSTRRALSEDPEAKPRDIAKVQGEIAQTRERLMHAGERLKAVSADEAPEVDEKLRDIATSALRDNLEAHDAAESELAALKAKKNLEPGDPTLTAAHTKLNNIKKQLPGFDLIDPVTGAVKTGSGAPIPKAGSVDTPKSEPEVKTPTPAAPATVTPEVTTSITGAPAARSMFVPGSTPSASKPNPFTPATPANADGDPWDAVAKKRDAAIANRNASLDTLTGAGLFSGAIAPAAKEFSTQNAIAEKAQTDYNDEMVARAEDQHRRLIVNLGGPEAYQQAIAEHRAKTGAPAEAPVAAAPESESAAPVEAPKVIKLVKDKDGNYIL